MRWDELPRSDNIEDRRSEDGGGGFSLGGGGIGIGTVVVLGLIGWALGIDPRVLIGGAEMARQHAAHHTPYGGSGRAGTPNDTTGQFVAAVLGSTETQWRDIFAREGREYRAPRLVLFSGATRSACGFAQAAVGPFYCPNDWKIYLDTSFFRDLRYRFHGCDGNKACEFSEAYVIAHEVGHHVQNLIGVLPRVQRMQRSVGGAESNRLQVEVELQADCLAGVWANRAQARWKLLDAGDVEQALKTAAAIGDDRLQLRARGYVVPDAFTHGSSQQRMHWFDAGFKGGGMSSCSTSSVTRLSRL
jgi:predicted metalloprotease